MNEAGTSPNDRDRPQAGGANGERESLLRFLFRASQVRVFVTHLMSWTFSLAALGMITWFLRHAMYQDAMTVFSHVVAVVGPIVGFWFGSKGRRGDDEERKREVRRR